MARKLFMHNKLVDGLEAPRNSLELRIENSQTYSASANVPVEEECSGKNYPLESSMKKLINEEISKHSSARKNAPSIVARLMGMDVLTADAKLVGQSSEKKNENMRTKHSNKEANGRGSVGHVSSNSISSRQMRLDLSYHHGDEDSGRWSNGQRSGKPRSREHPQEEELQKFKKEFEAWQAARFRECSRFVELGSTPTQFLAQEDLNKVKSEMHGKPLRTESGKSVKSKALAPKAKTNDYVNGFQLHDDRIEPFQVEQERLFPSKHRTTSRDFDQYSVMNTNEKLHTPSAATRIVILKPGPDRIYDHKESWSSSPSSPHHQRSSIEDFLEEVRERLKYEMQGKMLRRGSVVRGSGIETPYSEKPSSDRKQIAQTIGKQAKECLSRDMGINMKRLVSTRSYKSEVKFDGPTSPEFISRDTRRFVAERLLKRETDSRTSVGGHCRSFSLLDLDTERIRESRGDDQHGAKEINNVDVAKDEQHMKTRSFRQGLGDDRAFHRDLSPRNLIRSLSAPVSGTSFGKLLLEDRHVLTGVQIRRKLEGTENAFADIKKRKKERFNFKEKVSNFRYSFSLRGRLFGKRIPSVMESHVSDQYPLKDIMSGPTVVSNFGERHARDNFTEVPPSPASVCSSVQEEMWRPTDYLSPLSTHDVTPSDEYSLPQVFREISSNLTELRRQLNQLESGDPAEEEIIKPKPEESEMLELRDPDEAYVRDLLVASGLYDGSSSERFLRKWETLSKPISIAVFEEVEESYKKPSKEGEGPLKDNKPVVDHKLLHHLLNEALSTVLGQTSALSNLKRSMISSTVNYQTLQGKELFECVWEIMRQHLFSPLSEQPANIVDDLVARDMRMSLWSGAMEDVVNSLGREMESLIMGDLVDEFLEDMEMRVH